MNAITVDSLVGQTHRWYEAVQAGEWATGRADGQRDVQREGKGRIAAVRAWKRIAGPPDRSERVAGPACCATRRAAAWDGALGNVRSSGEVAGNVRSGGEAAGQARQVAVNVKSSRGVAGNDRHSGGAAGNRSSGEGISIPAASSGPALVASVSPINCLHSVGS